MTERRSDRFFLDREVQFALLWRVMSYWLVCLVTIGAMLVFWNAAFGPPRRGLELLGDVIQRYAPAMLASLALLPLVLVDALRLSHRFVGPVRRIRTGLRELGSGKRPERIKTRQTDFWPEMADEFNRAIDQIEETHDALVSSQGTTSLS